MRKRRVLALCLLGSFLALRAPLFADEAKNAPPRKTVDFEKIRLDVTLDEKEGKIRGAATHTFVPLWDDVDTVVLDAEDMEIKKVVLRGKRLKFEHEGRRLTVRLGREYGRGDRLDLAVEYEAKPRRGLYFVRPDEGYPSKPYQIWTQGEDEDSHYYFPCYDYPNELAESEINATVRKPYIVISNGELLGVEESGDGKWRTFRWRERVPHVSYLVSLIVGEFEEIRAEWDGVPLRYYVQQKDVEHAMNSFRKTPEMMRFFSDRIGIRYPYEKYAQTPVEEYMWGGMENVSATTLTQHTIHDDRAHLTEDSEGLVAHELAHQWWGDLLTCRDWSHLWLNEGFATYFDALFKEHDRGADEFKLDMLRNKEWYLEDHGWRPRPVVWREYEIPGDMFDGHSYEKGSWVLHMLRYHLGERDFWRGVQLYARRHQKQNVTTNDLRLAFEDAAGKNLEWFFEQWLYRAGHPEFDVEWSWDEGTGMVELRVRQTQEGEPFRVAVGVEIAAEDGARLHRVVLDGAEQRIYLPAPKKPPAVRFDKDGWVLKELSFEKEEEEWLRQIESDSDMLGRIEAAEELAAYPSPKAIAALAKALREDSYYGVRAEAAKLLADIATDEARAALLDATEDPDARVRVAAARALGEHKGPGSGPAVARLKALFEKDLSYRVQAEAVKALAKLSPEKESKKEDRGGEAEEGEKEEEEKEESSPEALPREELEEILSKALEMPSHLEVIRRAVFDAYVEMDDEEAVPTLREWMAYGKPTLCRTAALRAFGELSEDDPEEAARTVLAFLEDKSHRVRGAACSVLEELGEPLAVPALVVAAEEDPIDYVREAAKEAVKELQKEKEKRREEEKD
ncbi:MAG: HEAT repeat domain-containing protein [Acidobacteriota bacterium]|nr:MAG: HEAT repeat domain-containing protein [Acidobacteriota bacterium]